MCVKHLVSQHIEMCLETQSKNIVGYIESANQELLSIESTLNSLLTEEVCLLA